MKTLTLLLLTLWLTACSQTGTAVLNSFALTNDYQQTANIPYGAAQQSNKLDIYKPLKGTQKGIASPVLVFFYGGCWGQCSKLNKQDYRFVAQSFASRGFTTIIPDFGQYPETNFSGLMSDASRVLAWTTQNISSHGGDPQRIIIAGHSSGAHIAASLALDSRYLSPEIRKNIRGFIGLAGPYDFLPLDKAYQRALFNPVNNYYASQPLHFVTTDDPPLLILHGLQDTTVNPMNARSLFNEANRKGLKAQLKWYPAHDHVSILTALSRPFQNQTSVLKDMFGFMRSQTQ